MRWYWPRATVRLRTPAPDALGAAPQGRKPTNRNKGARVCKGVRVQAAQPHKPRRTSARPSTAAGDAPAAAP